MRYSALALAWNAITGQTRWTPAWRDAAPREAYDVVIVGGGGHGLATAYYLAKEYGITDMVATSTALVPHPRTPLVWFPGLFAPNVRHRRLVVPAPAPTPSRDGAEPQAPRTTRTAMGSAQRAAPACSKLPRPAHAPGLHPCRPHRRQPLLMLQMSLTPGEGRAARETSRASRTPS